MWGAAQSSGGMNRSGAGLVGGAGEGARVGGLAQRTHQGGLLCGHEEEAVARAVLEVVTPVPANALISP